MREKWQKQMPLMPQIKDHAQAKELTAISGIIDAHPIICDRVLQDLNKGKLVAYRTGADGMSADQVLRCAIVKILFGFTYDELAFHIVDSQALSWFCRIGIADKGYKKSALNKNIKGISDATWELINADLLGYAKQKGIEKGRQVRVDCTCVETHIHHPTDSNLLWDGVRVLTRLLKRFRDESGITVPDFHNHTRVAKRRMLAVMNAKRKNKRKVAYVDLLKTSRKVVGYAHKAVAAINAGATCDPLVMTIGFQIEHFVDLTRRVIHQTERRVLHGETVDAKDKVVSLFEPHTDIIVKDRRDTLFGHKICLTGGASNLILDCVITEGNPADADLTIPMLERQKQIYGRYPLKASFDGGFASKENLKRAQSRKIKDVCFAKKRGLSETDMCRSQYVYRRLRRFRAGIESGISWLKRCLGLTRCTWKGWDSFKSYVWSSIVAAMDFPQKSRHG
ncbi:transposase [Desulfosarcina widdelii]|uniref:Transposase n=1 Tax=Desulfosarcina widdelii TaxID=947919 RepID=A0A5K7Z5K9_9BACT|nr:ISNCY family transposase [Desulfosarcina widdelii]BBO74921.1 transposase [Desulfosarcina widdelii]